MTFLILNFNIWFPLLVSSQRQKVENLFIILVATIILSISIIIGFSISSLIHLSATNIAKNTIKMVAGTLSAIAGAESALNFIDKAKKAAGSGSDSSDSSDDKTDNKKTDNNTNTGQDSNNSNNTTK